jgi:O-methyltransferase
MNRKEQVTPGPVSVESKARSASKTPAGLARRLSVPAAPGSESISKMVAAGRALHRRFLRGDRYAGYQLAQGICSYLAPDYVFIELGRAWTEDTDFVATYRRVVGDKLMHTADKKWFLRELARFSCDFPGEIAECGSLRGASGYFIAEATSGTGKCLHLFDSWQGLSGPVHADGNHWEAGDLAVSEADCLATLAPFADRTVSHPGWIPDRFGDVEGLKFSLVHIDVDLYEPHRDALTFFWPRLTQGAPMIFDDYGSSFCPGARRAVDEFFGPLGLKVIGVPTGQAFIFKQPERR